MSETEAEKLLQKIASQPKKKKADRLRDMFTSLEAALLVKTREEVFEDLKEINLGITFNTFKKTIDRIRKERGITPPRKTKGKAAQALAATTKPAPRTSQPAAQTQTLVESESGVFEPTPENSQPPPTSTKSEEPTGIVDIFTIQAEREEEAKKNPKKQKIRRLS